MKIFATCRSAPGFLRPRITELSSSQGLPAPFRANVVKADLAHHDQTHVNSTQTSIESDDDLLTEHPQPDASPAVLDADAVAMLVCGFGENGVCCNNS